MLHTHFCGIKISSHSIINYNFSLSNLIAGSKYCIQNMKDEKI